ncbi:hypothetical protein CDD81_644 [Ophiocordyceps australis]|uniref:Uncharacterized protein n=1 Tax=Ophiocordyceps australis TaxID=1399860 RepID=A0A2C5Y0R4_9HYPO|nr:hypothetical protein CDD81_644 [Ophiocordyceps australis]
MIPPESQDAFKTAHDYWLKQMVEPEDAELSQEGLDRSIGVFFPEAPCEPGELSPNAGIDGTSLTIGKLAALVAYNKAIQTAFRAMDSDAASHESRDAKFGVNPFLPCLWLWSKRHLNSTNNLCVTFPPNEPFQVAAEDSGDAGDGQRVGIRVSLDLCPASGYQEWHVDGFNVYNFGNLPWFLGTLCSCVFSGKFKKRMGKTGTSVNRAVIILIRRLAAALELFVTISATFSFPILLTWKMKKHALVCIAGCVFGATNAVLMWLWIYRGVGLLPLRIIGELGAMVLFSVFAASQLVGISYVNGATTLFVVYSWFHYISLSCVLGDSRL